jgi:hypothetical protein
MVTSRQGELVGKMVGSVLEVLALLKVLVSNIPPCHYCCKQSMHNWDCTVCMELSVLGVLARIPLSGAQRLV